MSKGKRKESLKNVPKASSVKNKSAAPRIKHDVTWTSEHDEAIVFYVLKHRKPNNLYSLSRLLQSRPELLFGAMKAIQIKQRIMHIAAGPGNPVRKILIFLACR